MGTPRWETVGCQQGHPKMLGHFAEEGIYFFYKETLKNVDFKRIVFFSNTFFKGTFLWCVIAGTGFVLP